MLVSFSVRNFGPYADGATLMMVPGGGRLKGDHVFDGLLRHAVVYGANASGKSSLTDAVSMLRGLCTDPLFHLDSPKVNWDSDDPAIRFNVCFTSRGDTYDYSLEMEPSGDGGAPVTFRTVGECLRVSDAAGNEHLVFERGPSQERDGGKLGRLLSVDRDIRASVGTIMSQRDIASLEGAELDVESGSPTVVSPMADGHVLKDIDTRIDELLSSLRSNRSVMESLIDVSHSAPAVLSRDLTSVPGLRLDDLSAEEASGRAAEVRRWMSHSLRTLDGDLWLPDLRTLSAVVSSLDLGIDDLLWRRMDGRRAFETIGLMEPGQRVRLEEMRRMAEAGRFDASLDLASDRRILRFVSGLHPMMAWRLVELFGSVPSPSCQLVATTHDTGLMTTALLRRDEIWLVGKEDGVSHLTSMDDLRLRASEDLEKLYLDGRLPGAPRIGDARP